MGKWNFSAPMVQGKAPRQAHADIPSGLWEREMGRDAFFGPATDFYHRNPPNAWSAIDKNGPRPHVFDTRHIMHITRSPWHAAEMLVNDSIRIRYWKTSGSMDHLVRNADGDELIFMHRGSCELFCDFGHISLVKGDYCILPRGTMWRIEADGDVDMLLVESTDSPYRLPEESVLGRHLPFDPGVLDVPQLNETFRSQKRDAEWQIRVKLQNRTSDITFPFNPLDAEGWKGDLYPIRLNVKDIRPISCSRAHVVPSGHATFLSDRFLVCTFLPYPSPTDPSALQLPAYHENVECDEVLFLHDGQPTALTEGLAPGLMTLDPRGLTHGPLPDMQSYFHKPAAEMDNQFIVLMFDTRDPLKLGKHARHYELPAVQWLPAGGIKNAPDAVRKFHPLRQLAKAGAIAHYLYVQLRYRIRKVIY